jgi:hypothetical protein
MRFYFLKRTQINPVVVAVGLVITRFVLVQSLLKILVLCNNGGIYHCHLSRYFPRFSEGERSNTREASLMTSRDQVERLAKLTTPYLGLLDVIG